MATRKVVRRKSNWYIYLITFIITLALLSLAVFSIWDLLFPVKDRSTVSSSGVSDFRPDASNNSVVLFMLSEEKGAAPDYYMIINYRPRDEIAVIVPIKSNLSSFVGNVKGTLNDIYKSGGSASVIYAIKNVLGIEIDNYVKFDKNSFIDFFDEVGDTPMNVPMSVTINGKLIETGQNYFNGESLYEYITYDGFGQGEDYCYHLHGLAVTNFINANSRGLNAVQLQNIFNKLLNSTDTDLDFSVFTRKQSAYLYTTQNCNNIAEYYIPYGETDENGFTIVESSLETIKDRFGEINY